MLAQQGDTEQAIQAYERAVEVLQPIQHFLTTGYRQPIADFSSAVHPVYYELAKLLLQKAEDVSAQEEQELLKQTRVWLEQLKVAELQNALQDECLLKNENTQLTSLDKVMEADNETAMLYPVALDDHLVLLLNRGENIERVDVEVNHQDFFAAAKELQALLPLRLHNRFRQPAKALYNWLIRPIEPLLADIKTLVIVPEGDLRKIPLSTLYDGEHFLIEKYALSVAPSLHTYKPHSIDWQQAQMLMLGLSEAVQDYPALPSVPKELNSLKEIVGATTQITNQDYAVQRLQAEMQKTPYSIVHFATHGEFGGHQEDTYLLTYDGKMHMDTLNQVLSIGRYNEQPIELLTLSACKTAVGDDRAALGLAGVALKAGARSALASLWFVDDEATYETITEFYRQLRHQNLSKAKALQAAQVKMLQQKRYAHPVCWAPFVLIGNWL